MLVQVMEVLSVVVQRGSTLGISNETVTELLEALKPVCAKFEERMDFGLYFFSVERCSRFCERMADPLAGSTLLWDTAASVREELLGSISLEVKTLKRSSTRLSAAGPLPPPTLALFGGVMRPPVCPAAISKIRSALKRQYKVCISMKQQVVKSGELPSLKVKELAVRAKVIKSCWKTLYQLGPRSPRYSTLYGDGTRTPHQKEVDYTSKIFFQSQGCTVKAPTVGSYCKEFCGFLEWLTSLVVPLESCIAFHVASWLDDMSTRGKSVPARCLASLVWAASVFELQLWVLDDGVKLAGKGPSDRPPPKPARCPPISDMVTWELLVLDAHYPDLYRIIAGLCCCLCHGALRFKDFQTAERFEEAPDALIGSSFMKRQGMRSWVALKTGFSKKNWGSEFMQLLKKYGMPGSDYVLKRPMPDLSGFQEKPASFADCLHAMRLILVQVFAMDSAVAVTFTLHGFRHVLITCGRQLPVPLARDQQNEIGHWVPNSNMPNRYDAVASSVELQAKNRIVSYFQDGRRLLEPGELQQSNMETGSVDPVCGICTPPVVVSKSKPVCARDGCSAVCGGILPNGDRCMETCMLPRDHPVDIDDPSASHQWACSGHAHIPEVDESLGGSLFGKDIPIPGGSDFHIEGASDMQSDIMDIDPVDVPTPHRASVLSLPVQVENITASKLHLYHPSVHTEFSVCRLWKCGSASQPTNAASFYSSFDTIPLNPSSFNSQYQPCSNCFGLRLLNRYGWTTNIPTKTELMKALVAAPVEDGSDTLDESSAAGSSSSDSE